MQTDSASNKPTSNGSGKELGVHGHLHPLGPAFGAFEPQIHETCLFAQTKFQVPADFCRERDRTGAHLLPAAESLDIIHKASGKW
jgi:hypothetical protein